MFFFFELQPQKAPLCLLSIKFSIEAKFYSWAKMFLFLIRKTCFSTFIHVSIMSVAPFASWSSRTLRLSLLENVKKNPVSVGDFIEINLKKLKEPYRKWSIWNFSYRYSFWTMVYKSFQGLQSKALLQICFIYRIFFYI